MFNFTDKSTIKSLKDSIDAQLKIINKKSSKEYGSDCTQYCFIYESQELAYIVGCGAEGDEFEWEIKNHRDLNEIMQIIRD